MGPRPSAGALTGTRVVDFSRIIAGPLCTMYLADLGADVIKVERPGAGDDAREYTFPSTWGGEGAIFLAFNRHKRSLALDLQKEAGREAALVLVRDADVLVENFRTGVMERLGLGYDRLAEINPKLVYCSITGFGASGPMAASGANDLIAQAFGGLMSLNADAAGEPFKVAPAVVDAYTGLTAALAVVAALHSRAVTGRGQRIDTSLLECGTALLSYFVVSCLATGEAPTQRGPSASITVPNRSFRTADGWLVLAANNEPMWRRLCEAVGRPDLADDARFRTNSDRMVNQEALTAALSEVLAGRSRAEWQGVFEAARVTCAPVQDIGGLLASEQLRALRVIVPVPHPLIPEFRAVRPPFAMSGTPPSVGGPPPRLGEHSVGILREIGYGDEQIRRLVESGVIEHASPQG